MSDTWCPVLGFASRGAAEAVAVVLEAESVPTMIQARHLVLAVDRDFVLSVPASLVHRVRWILAQSELSDSELTYLATGELPDPE